MIFEAGNRPFSRPLNSVANSPHEHLALIRVCLVDKKHDQVSTSRFDSIHRDIDAQFNALEANINLQTLVVVLDFFGLGATGMFECYSVLLLLSLSTRDFRIGVLLCIL